MDVENTFIRNELYFEEKKDNLIGETDISTSILNIKEFSDYVPMPHTNYFGNQLPDAVLEQTKIPTLIIGIVFYNEHVTELIRTLISLEQQIRETRDLCKIQIIIVGDGIKQMDSSTHLFLRDIFCKSSLDLQLWDDMVQNLYNSEKKTCIIQRRLMVDGVNIRTCVKFPTSNMMLQLPMTLILKSENRRKHNSQEWILNSFCRYAFENVELDDNRFVFMTDCGTYFENECLKKMLHYMIQNENCVGCTGRQRVMSAEQQDCLEYSSFFRVEKLSSFLLRMIQGVDYEVSYATYTGGFALGKNI